jgi:hypothetical protein
MEKHYWGRKIRGAEKKVKENGMISFIAMIEDTSCS